MPTKAVSAAVMEVGKKGSGKHWTVAQIAAREKAAEAMKRKKKVKLTPPAWLGAEAKKVWQKKLKEATPVDLLDVLDEESLAVYCDAVVQYRSFSRMRLITLE